MMKKMQPSRFAGAVDTCRAAYDEFKQLQRRTRRALFKALGFAYTLWNEIQSDPQMRACFERLLVDRPKRQRHNPTLFLVQYLYFHNLLEYGQGNKRDQNAASRYSALLNTAWERGISPPQFESEAPAIGIQGAATRSQRKRQVRFGKRTMAKRMPNREMEPQQLYPGNFRVGQDLNEVILESDFKIQRVIINVLIDKGRLTVVKVRHYSRPLGTAR